MGKNMVLGPEKKSAVPVKSMSPLEILWFYPES